ncbi:MAG: response regulator, partial [Desulfobacterales bacterium]|nr:response regulator [Desulfobacterales bacterium]
MARVLIIDDDPVILEVIGEILKTHGYHVVAAPDGGAGIRELERNYYDLVLTDLVMP